MKRELGEGRWDRILKRRLLELSVSDNYDEAKHEWIATGNVWWSGNGVIPDWVNDTGHQDHCLCGHGIVYHFHIRNTENGNENVVGSDHINSYLIMRQIAEELKIDVGLVTDEQVAEWIKVRVGSMKAEAWWAENGERFEERFNFVKEYDLWTNTRIDSWYWDYSLEMSRRRLVLRKKGKGIFGDPQYEMASIVWRWNHPDNPKNQQRVHGYPNKKLMDDINLLFLRHKDDIAKFHESQSKLEEKRTEIANRKRMVAEARKAEEEERQKRWEEERPAREAAEAARAEERLIRREERKIAEEREALVQKAREEANLQSTDAAFDEMCQYYGIESFDLDTASNDWERKFLSSIKTQMSNKRELSDRQVQTLERLLVSPATPKQIKFLIDLGYENTDSIKSKHAASKLISRLLAEKKD